jgi:O-antigen ligase
MSYIKSIQDLFCKLTQAIRSNKKEYNLASLGIFIFTLYIFIQRWFTLSQASNILQGIIVFIALVLLLHKQDPKKLMITPPTKIEIFWFIGIFIIIVNIALVGINKYLFDIFMYSTGFAFLFLGKMDIEKYKASFSLIKYLSVIFAFGSILQYFFTDSFNGFIFSVADIYTQETIMVLTQLNYFPGFGLTRPAVTAGLIALGIGLIISFWDYRNKIKASINILLLLILFTGLLMTGKRSILLWLFVALIIVFISTALKGNILKRLLIIVTTLSLAIVVTGLLLKYADSFQFLARLDSLIKLLIYGIDVTGSVQVRLLMYKDALQIALENPLFGIGWHQFVQITSGLYPASYHVHNVYIQLFCEMGLVGFTAVMLPMVYTYTLTYKALKVVHHQPVIINPLWRKSLTLSLYSQTLFLLHNLTENPFYVINFVLMYFLMVSIVNAFIVIGTNEPIQNNARG